jgi:hypothetical protein
MQVAPYCISSCFFTSAIFIKETFAGTINEQVCKPCGTLTDHSIAHAYVKSGLTMSIS